MVPPVQITWRALYKSHDVRYPRPVAQLTFQRARTEENKRQRAAALVEAARSLAVETGVASVTLTAVASRAGIHYSAVRRYFTSHKEVLLHLAAEGWVRWSNTVCEDLSRTGAMSPARVAETLANGLAADPLFCDLLANLHLHLEHEVDIERVVEIRRTIAAAAIALADAIERALPVLGRSGAFDIVDRRVLVGRRFLADRQPPGAAIRRLRGGAGVPPARVEHRFRVRSHPSAHRHLYRSHAPDRLQSNEGGEDDVDHVRAHPRRCG